MSSNFVFIVFSDCPFAGFKCLNNVLGFLTLTLVIRDDKLSNVRRGRAGRFSFLCDELIRVEIDAAATIRPEAKYQFAMPQENYEINDGAACKTSVVS